MANYQERSAKDNLRKPLDLASISFKWFFFIEMKVGLMVFLLFCIFDIRK